MQVLAEKVKIVVIVKTGTCYVKKQLTFNTLKTTCCNPVRATIGTSK